ncbi:MAG TPA: transcription termination factor NusA [Fimbriimonas sp.]|nr:transcription termination factor NusA [Fimbriimonas sp.]
MAKSRLFLYLDVKETKGASKMEGDIMHQLQQIAQERDLPLEELQDELEEALAAAYKKYVGARGEVNVKLDPRKGWTASVEKEVVAVVIEPSFQMSLVEARRRNPEAEIGDFIPMDVDPNRFGRIAAQTAKQVLSQKLREAETRRIHDVFAEKMGDLVTGQVSRRDDQNVYIQVNRVEAELPRREQVPTEKYTPNKRMKVYVYKVDDTQRRLKVIVSRTHPNLLRKLFELEVPEIATGIVQIKNVAREPGQRSKVAVFSNDERVDPQGACIGPRGARVQAICDELNDEKIDVVPYKEDAKEFIIEALSPAKISNIKLSERVNERGETEKHAFVVVPDNQQSLAIGKGGQNVRLAARLTGWTIDIRSEAQIASERGRG